MYNKIVTHNDFDGLVSAALCMRAWNVHNVVYTGPNNIINSQIVVREKDIICDLPYPLTCALWFDHHEGNLDLLKYRNIDYQTLPGRFAPEKSCARVISDYLKDNNIDIPEFLEETVIATDKVDSFDYKDIDEWLEETPASIINGAINNRRPKQKNFEFLKRVTQLIAWYPLDEVAEDEEILNEFDAYFETESRMLEIIRDNIRFIPEDENQELIIIDLTELNHFQRIYKNLAMIDYPHSLAILSVQNQFLYGEKTNNLAFSMSLTIEANNKEQNYSCAEIMRELELGDGHPGAAAGSCDCKSKEEMKNRKEELLLMIYTMFAGQK